MRLSWRASVSVIRTAYRSSCLQKLLQMKLGHSLPIQEEVHLVPTHGGMTRSPVLAKASFATLASATMAALAASRGRVIGAIFGTARTLPKPPGYFLISVRNQPFFFSGIASSVPAVSAGGATASPNFSKNSVASFFAVASIRREPSWASLPPICAFTS